VGLISSGQETAAGCCECGNEILCSSATELNTYKNVVKLPITPINQWTSMDASNPIRSHKCRVAKCCVVLHRSLRAGRPKSDPRGAGMFFPSVTAMSRPALGRTQPHTQMGIREQNAKR
jgi:hypothetical protein